MIQTTEKHSEILPKTRRRYARPTVPSTPCERQPSVAKANAKQKMGNKQEFKTRSDCIVEYQFGTGEIILAPAHFSELNVKTSSQRLTYDGSKSLISSLCKFTSLRLAGHDAPGVESVERPRGRPKPDFVGRVGHMLRRRMLTWIMRVQMELQTHHFDTVAAHTATSPGMETGTVYMRNV